MDLSRDLLTLAHVEFPRLMRHPDFREDAMQELRLVQFLTKEEPVRMEFARTRLAWLAYELGVVPEKPGSEGPLSPHPTFYEEFAAALDFDRTAA